MADVSAQRMNAKIRDAQLMKVPYMLVVGENEMKAGQVSFARETARSRTILRLASSSQGRRIGLQRDQQSFRKYH